MTGLAGDKVLQRPLAFYDAVWQSAGTGEPSMSVTLDSMPSMIDRIRHDLVGLKMPRALEALDHVVRRLEHGALSALEAIDILLSEELTLRENSRIKTALRVADGQAHNHQNLGRLRLHLPAVAR